MQIINDKALLVRTKSPEKYSIIPKSKHLKSLGNGVHEVLINWGVDEARVLKNLGVKNVPSPIERHYDWPGRHKPFKHQIETASFLTLHRRAFVFSEPGTGKTLSALWAADYLMRKGYVRRCLIICPLSIMHSAWMGDIGKSVIHRSAAVAHHTKVEKRKEVIYNDYEFVITNYEGLNMLWQDILDDDRFDLIIVDECFVAGTLVATPAGKKPIELLQAGDEVFTSSGVARIKRAIRNETTNLLKVTLNDGQTITCTPEHPFFTDAGWVCAKDLTGRRLISSSILSDMRQRTQAQENNNNLGDKKSKTHGDVLLEILRTEEMAPTKPTAELFFTHATRTTGEINQAKDGISSHEVISGTERDGTQTNSTWWERNGNDADGETFITNSSAGLGVELPSSVGQEAARLSHELQARFCMASSEDRIRSGRLFACGDNSQDARQEEGRLLDGTWVESISYIEPNSPVFVYNLEIEGTPNYFVGDGYLAHNCNAYKNPSTTRWKSLNKIVTARTTLWMMTGTPAAQSPVDAYGLAKLVNPTGVPKFMTAWKERVMRKVTMYKWVAKPDAKDKVFDALQPAIRFTKAECLDLPPVITLTRDVPLTAQQNKYYKMLKEQLLINASGETITAVNAAAAINKLLQISAGAAYTDKSEVVDFDCSPRLNVLLEVLEETDRKVLVFAPFRHSIEVIHEFLTKQGIASDVIHGNITANNRHRIFTQFQKEDNPRILVIQPQAASHGVTLTAADTVVFWGPVMSVDTYIQCCARTDRVGQDSDKVTVVHLQGSDVERRMFKQLERRVQDHSEVVKLYEEILAS
ncbi:MAG TPA: helicase-related protein [Ferrovaceae bacterium]|nr:helicase-related protein [Ferrovaceae bacterium]